MPDGPDLQAPSQSNQKSTNPNHPSLAVTYHLSPLTMSGKVSRNPLSGKTGSGKTTGHHFPLFLFCFSVNLVHCPSSTHDCCCLSTMVLFVCSTFFLLQHIQMEGVINNIHLYYYLVSSLHVNAIHSGGVDKLVCPVS
jgi:hypothetical protein